MRDNEIKQEILRGIYYGEFDVCEESVNEIEGYKECMNKVKNIRSDLETMLNSEQKELLERYMNIYTELEGIMQFHYFSRGWEIGIMFKKATE